MTIKTIIMAIGIVLMILDAIGIAARVDLFKLGLAFFLAGFGLI